MTSIPSIREYGCLHAHELSQRTVLRQEQGWTLTHHTTGYEPAGSVARYTGERWSVITLDARSNTRYGRSFNTIEKAQTYFEERTAASLLGEPKDVTERR